MSDLWDLVDICRHQEHHPGGGALPQPKAGLKSGGKPPPPPLRSQRCPLEPMGRVRFPPVVQWWFGVRFGGWFVGWC